MNVVSYLPRQVRDGSENTARQKVTLDFGEPQFHLVQPGRIRWSEVEANLGVIGEELLNGFGLVRREIIENDVNFLGPPGAAHQIRNEGDEFFAGVPLGRFSLDFAGLDVQRCIERQRAMPIILKAVALRAAW